jgi:hypothetical protein
MTTTAMTRSPGDRYRFPQVARMEWIKLRGLRSTTWTLLITAAGTVGTGIAVLASQQPADGEHGYLDRGAGQADRVAAGGQARHQTVAWPQQQHDGTRRDHDPAEAQSGVFGQALVQHVPWVEAEPGSEHQGHAPAEHPPARTRQRGTGQADDARLSTLFRSQTLAYLPCWNELILR